MRVFQIEGDWSLDHLRLAERPRPVAGPGQVLLHMRASALNYRDLVVPRRGYGNKTGTLPLIPVSDGVGEVVEVGAGVDSVRLGERVCPLFFQKWIGGEPNAARMSATLGGPLDGTMAEFMALPAAGVAAAPEGLDDIEAATLPCAGVTAWRAVVSEGGVRAGDVVLVQGTGGVSLFALQFAKAAGARVIVTSSSDAKLERARVMGADAGINYRSVPAWGERAKVLAGGDGVDHVVEVGGSDTLPQSLRAVRPGGTISLIGVLSGGTLELPLGPIVTRHVRLQGITVGSRDDFEAMCRAIVRHTLRPAIDRVFAFEELPAALAHLASGGHFGKIAIRH